MDMVQISCPFYLSSSITHSNVFPPLLNFHWYRKAESIRLCTEPQGPEPRWMGYSPLGGDITPSAVPRDVPTGNARHSLHQQCKVLKASSQPSQQQPHVQTHALTCQPRTASCPRLGEPPPAPAREAGSGPRPREPFALAAFYNSAGEDLCRPSSYRGKKRNCCFLVPCEQQGRPGGTQDIFPNISGLIFIKKSPNTQCQHVAWGVSQWASCYGCTAQGMCALEPFSHALGINSCTSCMSNPTTKVSNNPGKNLHHSFPSSLHPSSPAILQGIQPPMNSDSQWVGKNSLAHAQRQGKCGHRAQHRSALLHTGPHHFPAWRKPGWPWRLGTGVAAVRGALPPRRGNDFPTGGVAWS